VVRLHDGQVHWRAAIDERKAEHAFGAQGVALYAIAQQLCQALAAHWALGTREEWRPPFEDATLAQVDEFTARDVESALDFALRSQSSLYTLLSEYEIPVQARPAGIVRRVQQLVRRQQTHRHLEKRFGRELDIGRNAGVLRVDFLGQNYACYFMQLTESERGVEGNTERALAKLYELQALRRFVQGRPKSFGLLDEERPSAFELIAVGDKNHAAQRQALARITLLADKGEVRTRPMHDVQAAAEHVINMERKAA